MHLLFTAQYRVRDDATGPRLFVKNVPVSETSRERDPEIHLRPILRSAAVAEAARSTADQILTNASSLVDRIRRRAQQELDALNTGIEIVTITADKSYYPLQVKSEFIEVSAAESRRTQLIQDAYKAREETLQEAAGAAWKPLSEEIEKLSQAENEAELEAVIARICDLIEKEATGEAGRMIQEARRDRESIVEETRARADQFKILLDAYRRDPDLVKTTLQKDMLQKLWEEPGVQRYLLPEGEHLPVIWLNKDPVELRKADEEDMRKSAGTR
jgi:regulator of protease activity HflC (stomatin/prohibitin superfamily)